MTTVAAVRAARRVRQRSAEWLALLPAGFLVLLVLVAVFAGAIAPHDPNQQNLGNFLLPPGPGHWLGTDDLGRDVLSRLLYGARVSLVAGVASVVIAGVIGVPLGILGAMSKRWVGGAVMRATDLVLALPAVLIALAVAATIGPSLLHVIILIGCLYWAEFARMVYGEALSLREREYIQSAYAIGCSETRVLLRYYLPSLLSTIIVMATLQIASAILLEATLSFLGVGVPPPTPSWGTMVAAGRPYVQLAWWTITFPGVAIMLTVLSINLVGDYIRDWLDPKFSLRRH